MLSIKNLKRNFLSILQQKKNDLLIQLAIEADGLTLLDIGAAGQIEPRWRPIASQLRYIGVEPDERSSLQLTNNYKCREYKIINSLIWSSSEEISLYLCDKPEVSSAFQPNTSFINRFPENSRFEVKGVVNFKGTTLDSELKKRVVDFVKLDIQGAELNALQGMQNSLRPCFGLEVEIEFSELYKNQPLFGEVNNYLSSNDFEFIDFTNLCRWERNSYNSLGQCVFGDALWLRSPEFVANHFTENYLKYIVICSLYGRYDLVLKTLEIIDKPHSNKFIKAINKLIKIQKNTLTAQKLMNKILNLISQDKNTRMHLIY